MSRQNNGMKSYLHLPCLEFSIKATVWKTGRMHVQKINHSRSKKLLSLGKFMFRTLVAGSCGFGHPKTLLRTRYFRLKIINMVVD